jgi:hypothetical protein
LLHFYVASVIALLSDQDYRWSMVKALDGPWLKAPTHDAKGHWLPGRSGNPGGRPSVEKAVIEFCKRNLNRNVEDLQRIADDEANPLGIRVVLKQWLVERVIGKTPLTVHLRDDHILTIDPVDQGL